MNSTASGRTIPQGREQFKLDDPEYREALRARMIDGTAGAMEPLLSFYAKGKPVERVEQVERFPHAHLSDEELRLRLLDAANSLTPEK